MSSPQHRSIEHPQRSRIYQNHHFDSTRWNYFEARPDDVVIATSYKAGTTWMQSIVAHLLFPDGDLPASVSDLSPWLDMRTTPLEIVLEGLRAQSHRRFIKTHLPLDGLPYDERVRYVFVGRDGRDVFMSLWNHYSNHSDAAFAEVNECLGRVGDPFPRPPEDLHEFWRDWATRGWFDWETDGWPYWSHLHHAQTWWDHRHLPNVELFHFADLLADLDGEVRRVAVFLGVDVPDEAWPGIVDSVTFENMKKRGERYAPGGGSHWKGGADTFLHRGTNGRWKDVLTKDELALYDAACDRVLTPDCRAWLAEGRGASPGDTRS